METVDQLFPSKFTQFYISEKDMDVSMLPEYGAIWMVGNQAGLAL